MSKNKEQKSPFRQFIDEIIKLYEAKGYLEGYKEGYENGYLAGLEKAKKIALETLKNK